MTAIQDSVLQLPFEAPSVLESSLVNFHGLLGLVTTPDHAGGSHR